MASINTSWEMYKNLLSFTALWILNSIKELLDPLSLSGCKLKCVT